MPKLAGYLYLGTSKRKLKEVLANHLKRRYSYSIVRRLKELLIEMRIESRFAWASFRAEKLGPREPALLRLPV